jgi:hypothetical protein
MGFSAKLHFGQTINVFRRVAFMFQNPRVFFRPLALSVLLLSLGRALKPVPCCSRRGTVLRRQTERALR